MPSRDVSQLILEVDARIATAQRSVNQLARAVQQDSANMTKALGSVEQSHARLGRALNDNGRLRAGFTQLSFQIGDVTQQMSLGVSASRIFAQQSGQVIQALQVMGGEGNKFLQFMGGPWGIAISTAAVILAPLASKLFDTGDEVGKLVDKMREQAKQAALNREADEAWKNTVEGLTEAIRKRREEQEKSLQTDIQAEQQSLREAQQELQRQKQKLGKLREDLVDATIARNSIADRNRGTNLEGANTGALKRAEERIAEIRKQIAETQATIASAEANVRGAQATISERAVDDKLDPVKAATDAYTRTLGNLREALQAGAISQKQFEDRLEAAKRKLKEVQDAANGATGGLAKVTLSEVQGLLNSNFDLFPESSHQLTKGKHAKNSYHYAGQAIDFVPRGGMGSITKDQIRSVVEAQGIKILELLGPGDKGHSDHFHLAFAKQRLGPDQLAAAQARRDKTAETAEQKALRQQNAFEEQRDRLNQELIRAQTDLVQGIDAQADAAETSLKAEQSRRDKVIQNDVEEGKLTQAQAEQLKVINASIAAEKIKAIEIGRQVDLLRQQDERQQRSFEYQADDLRFADEMARTQAAHRQLQLEILDVVYQEKEAHLRSLKAQLEIAGKLEDAADVQAQLDRLPYDKANDRRRVLNGTKNPLEALADQAPRSAQEIIEAFQSIEAQGIDRLGDAIADVVTGTKSLGEAFSDVARSIIADLVRMTIRMLIFRALSSVLGGGLQNPFGNGPAAVPVMDETVSLLPRRAGGGLVVAGQPYLVGERRPEVFVPSTSGMILPNVPRVGVPQAARSNGGPLELVIGFGPAPEFAPFVQSVSAAHAQEAIKVSVNHTNSTLRSIAKPKLMGGRG